MDNVTREEMCRAIRNLREQARASVEASESCLTDYGEAEQTFLTLFPSLMEPEEAQHHARRAAWIASSCAANSTALYHIVDIIALMEPLLTEHEVVQFS